MMLSTSMQGHSNQTYLLNIVRVDWHNAWVHLLGLVWVHQAVGSDRHVGAIRLTVLRWVTLRELLLWNLVTILHGSVGEDTHGMHTHTLHRWGRKLQSA